jgi:hypothetical protein
MNPHRPDRTTIDYFRRVEQMVRQNALDNAQVTNLVSDLQEEKSATIDKVLKDVLCSRVIEQVVPLMNDEQVNAVFRFYRTKVGYLVSDRHASHVLETLIKSGKITAENMKSFLVELTLDESAFATNCVDTYASHVIRTSMPSIATEESDILPKVTEFIFSRFDSLAKDANGSFVLQALLDAAAPSKMPSAVTEETFFDLCSHPKAAYVMQKMAEKIPSKRWWRFLKKNMAKYLSDRNANFVVQTILEHQHESMKQDYIDEILKVVSEMPENACPPQVVQKLALCIKSSPEMQAKHASLFQARMEKDAFLRTVITENFVPQFVPEPDMTVDALKNDKNSRFAEAFLKNPNIPFVQKQKTINKMKGSVAALAMDKCGSRVLERAFKEAEPSKRKWITKELQEDKHKIERSQYGRFVMRNCREERSTGAGVKRELQDFLQEEESGAAASKKPRRT